MFFPRTYNIDLVKLYQSCTPLQDSAVQDQDFFTQAGQLVEWYASCDKYVISTLYDKIATLDKKTGFDEGITLEDLYNDLRGNILSCPAASVSGDLDLSDVAQSLAMLTIDLERPARERRRTRISLGTVVGYYPKKGGGGYKTHFLSQLITGAVYAQKAVEVVACQKLGGCVPDARYRDARDILEIYNRCLSQARNTLDLPESFEQLLKKQAMGQGIQDAGLVYAFAGDLKQLYHNNIDGHCIKAPVKYGLPLPPNHRACKSLNKSKRPPTTSPDPYGTTRI